MGEIVDECGRKMVIRGEEESEMRRTISTPRKPETGSATMTT
jgi:hypothetical protein